MNYEFNGTGMGLGNLARLSNAVTRSVSPENFTGEKGKGGMATEGEGLGPSGTLGQGWKISPCIQVEPGTAFTMADIAGPGVIQHIWLTCPVESWRHLILNIYWDDETEPSVRVPAGDFFCNGWCERSLVNSLPISVNPANGFNSYWEMPFRKRARFTMENVGTERKVLYYQINYTLTSVPDDMAYFHAQWRRSNPLAYMDVHTIVDGIRGKGHYVGTYLAWQVNSNNWWGEGEVKCYLDGDTEFPTICGTGLEDYFGGAWNWDMDGQYVTYSTPFLGMHQHIKADGLYRANQRFGMYRWHVMDPIRFETDFRVTVQALGWRSGGKYLPLQDDISSVAYWYQTEPHVPHPALPHREQLEVI
ncbi:hypothetical protein PAT3040_00030 [Paenibacillus agaridevorans]|uniref:DUF2961 domain-containing protein n=1 Tax=Paenibacillus agaridevorans TaxID=171404 RepID=A0A2R5EIU9_9BACL|nr:glycoside hydrolase family 172 protein [Paenibacillus agaridevorans]GBG05549.1 hypothetical protein PAT3040_00030 [Paenibacillus agaridevorans]